MGKYFSKHKRGKLKLVQEEVPPEGSPKPEAGSSTSVGNVLREEIDTTTAGLNEVRRADADLLRELMATDEQPSPAAGAQTKAKKSS